MLLLLSSGVREWWCVGGLWRKPKKGQSEREKERGGVRIGSLSCISSTCCPVRHGMLLLASEWRVVSCMQLVCLRGKWTLIMQLSLTFAISDHPTSGDFYIKNYYLFIYLFLGPIFAPGWPKKETGIFSLKFLFFFPQKSSP